MYIDCFFCDKQERDYSVYKIPYKNINRTACRWCNAMQRKGRQYDKDHRTWFDAKIRSEKEQLPKKKRKATQLTNEERKRINFEFSGGNFNPALR